MLSAFVIELPLIAEIVAAAGALIGMWWAGVRWVWPRLIGTWRALSGLMEIGTQSEQLTGSMSRIQVIENDLRHVRHEVLPNGGGSLRDAVTRTEQTVQMIVARQRTRDDAEDEVARLDIEEDGRVVWLAAALMRWTQRTSDDLKGNGWMSFIAPDEREDVAEEYARCIRHKRQFDGAFRIIDRDGGHTLVRMSAVPFSIRMADGTKTTQWTATMKRIQSAPDSLSVPERAR